MGARCLVNGKQNAMDFSVLSDISLLHNRLSNHYSSVKIEMIRLSDAKKLVEK